MFEKQGGRIVAVIFFALTVGLFSACSKGGSSKGSDQNGPQALDPRCRITGESNRQIAVSTARISRECKLTEEQVLQQIQ